MQIVMHIAIVYGHPSAFKPPTLRGRKDGRKKDRKKERKNEGKLFMRCTVGVFLGIFPCVHISLNGGTDSLGSRDFKMTDM